MNFCIVISTEVLLSEIDGQDNDGRFYPFFEENRLTFKIQVYGAELVHPLGDPASRRTITFNILTK